MLVPGDGVERVGSFGFGPTGSLKVAPSRRKPTGPGMEVSGLIALNCAVYCPGFKNTEAVALLPTLESRLNNIWLFVAVSIICTALPVPAAELADSAN